MFVEAGADVEVCGTTLDKRLPVHAIAEKSNHNVLLALLLNTADVHIQDRFKGSPLMLACMNVEPAMADL